MIPKKYLIAAAERGLVTVRMHELAKLTGYAAPTVRDALHGRSGRSDACIRAVEKALGLSPEGDANAVDTNLTATRHDASKGGV